MPKQIFINLPVRDLSASIAFYTAIGAEQDLQFSDDTAACMVMTDTIFVMLLTHAKWATFTHKPIVDAHRDNEAMLALSCDSSGAVDAMVEAAAAHGGKADVNPMQEMDFMYSRMFEDPDGHVWEPFYMDMSKLPQD